MRDALLRHLCTSTLIYSVHCIRHNRATNSNEMRHTYLISLIFIATIFVHKLRKSFFSFFFFFYVAKFPSFLFCHTNCISFTNFSLQFCHSPARFIRVLYFSAVVCNTLIILVLCVCDAINKSEWKKNSKQAYSSDSNLNLHSNRTNTQHLHTISNDGYNNGFDVTVFLFCDWTPPLSFGWKHGN